MLRTENGYSEELIWVPRTSLPRLCTHTRTVTSRGASAPEKATAPSLAHDERITKAVASRTVIDHRQCEDGDMRVSSTLQYTVQ